MNANQIKTAENMLADMIAHLNTMSDMLSTDKADDTVLAWDNGLCVVMDEGKHPRAAGPVHATAFRPGDTCPSFAFPVIMNGNHHTAKPRLRRAILIQNIQQTEDAIKIFKHGLEAAKKGEVWEDKPF